MADEAANVLLVEDSADDSAFITGALKKADLTAGLRVAQDGAQATSLIFGNNDFSGSVPRMVPRLIILDLKLPKVDGLELLRRLKSNPYTRSVPVVVLSSSREKRDLRESYLLGANSFLVKPMDFDEFAEMIRVLGRYWLQFNQTTKQ